MLTATDYRPKHLDELVGQDGLKQKARIASSSAFHRGEPLQHCLLTSLGGELGKTTFAAISSNECFAPLVSISGQCRNTVIDLRDSLGRLKPGNMSLDAEALPAGAA